MQVVKGQSIAWIAIYGAIIGVTSFIPLIPYVTGGGFLPLSISLAAVAPLILGFRGGVIAALVGGLIGMFINPATYPFGFVDVFFVGMTPAIFCGFAFKGTSRVFRIIYIIILLLSGIMAGIVPYYYPGASKGFGTPTQPYYLLLVAFFFVPWLIVYILPIGTKYIAQWVNSENAGYRFAGSFFGMLIGLIPWSLWMIAPAAFALNMSPELAIAAWLFAAWSRVVLAIIAAIIVVLLIPALSKSGMPVPAGAIWEPKK